MYLGNSIDGSIDNERNTMFSIHVELARTALRNAFRSSMSLSLVNMQYLSLITTDLMHFQASSSHSPSNVMFGCVRAIGACMRPRKSQNRCKDPNERLLFVQHCRRAVNEHQSLHTGRQLSKSARDSRSNTRRNASESIASPSKGTVATVAFDMATVLFYVSANQVSLTGKICINDRSIYITSVCYGL